MTDKSGEKSAGEPGGFPLKWGLWGAAVVGVAAVVYIIAQASITPQQKSALKPLARGEMAKFVVPAEAAPPPAESFLDAGGQSRRIDGGIQQLTQEGIGVLTGSHLCDDLADTILFRRVDMSIRPRGEHHGAQQEPGRGIQLGRGHSRHRLLDRSQLRNIVALRYRSVTMVTA